MKICNQVRLKVWFKILFYYSSRFLSMSRGLMYLFSGMTFRDFSTVFLISSCASIFFIRLWFSDVSLSLIGSRPAD